jgi:hypothetical protein
VVRRHTDHATPDARGGPTSLRNGLGECEACNYAKEAPGWRVHTWCDSDGRHTAEFTTPTDSRHRSTAPPLLGDLVPLRASGIEIRFGDELAWHDAA